MPTCLINGHSSELISSYDRGLLYGDGLFETMAVVDGMVPLWQLHLDRLHRGCEKLHLACPAPNELQQEVEQLASKSDRAIMKLILTRGVGGRGYLSPPVPAPTRILQFHPWPELPRSNWETGIKAIFCAQRLARQPVLAGIKHLNRLEQVLARAEWQDPTIQEGLLANTEGDIIEAVSHNLFIVKENGLVTPDLQFCGVAGVMREYILKLVMEKGISVQIATLSRQDVLAAEAVFLCNSVHGIWPVCELDGKHYQQNDLVYALRDAVAQMIPYP